MYDMRGVLKPLQHDALLQVANALPRVTLSLRVTAGP